MGPKASSDGLEKRKISCPLGTRRTNNSPVVRAAASQYRHSPTEKQQLRFGKSGGSRISRKSEISTEMVDYMRARVCVCMYVRMYVCMYVCTYVRAYVRMYVVLCICVCVCVCVCVCTCVCVCVCTCVCVYFYRPAVFFRRLISSFIPTR